MSSITPAALRNLKADGFTCVWEKFGPPGCGKTTGAMKQAKLLLARGQTVHIEDEIFEGEQNGVRVWARGPKA